MHAATPRRAAAVVLLGAWFAFPHEPRAETQASFAVAAVVTPGCTVDGLGSDGAAGRLAALDFGIDSALSTAVRTADAAAGQAITLRCTPGVTLLMRIDGGAHAVGGVRHLQHDPSQQRLAYRLYRDAGFADEIGIDQTHAIAIPGTGADGVVLPVHGRLALPGSLPPGTYDDTVVVTLDW
ncbi:spore coat U domain-containing protein [Luteimonas sp. XNQY3]|nr:spore coat U domain-containing protein [Luteimonas sp. XNQY3]MCD9005492.1 spore coat U domain-containing protein [Luteimonas sp. XNQY3]